ncbi:MAG: AP-endonuc-2 domain-containing protein [Thermocaproicibacter melissae]|uniref:sugar phosphate isomerase/epimerase family protein n=1 Tax=Thermocaproicibacter melissae TaxID=2966552 RepID=UPI0024B1BDB6|nr:sugar phosphate isomerase/epimerase family protein [Thermocaproicibacter melissae]WBY64128.1 sugar phosphate isomerase/epimerase [Thermocaproicibacter melissae]
MRIGGAIEKPYSNPEEWYQFVKELGYRAVLAPIDYRASKEEKQAYLKCAKEHDLVIGEVGVWKNVLALDDAERKAAMEYAKNQLALADELGANCCVNVPGSRGEIWDGGYRENYAEDTYALVVDSIREIIDSVKPTRTFYTVESLPWMVPDSPDQYLQLIHDVDRKAFAVHLDYVNMINCPKRYLFCDEFIEECFQKLGPYIKSIHGKDVIMENAYTTLIHETMPGKGIINYQKVARLCESLGPDTTLFVEHLPDFESYMQAASYVREQAALAGVKTD